MELPASTLLGPNLVRVRLGCAPIKVSADAVAVGALLALIDVREPSAVPSGIPSATNTLYCSSIDPDGGRLPMVHVAELLTKLPPLVIDCGVVFGGSSALTDALVAMSLPTFLTRTV